MALTGSLVLPTDIVLTPVAELSEKVRSQLDAAPGDYAITRPGSRSPSKVIDMTAANLLEAFRGPQTIAGAILGYCRATGRDPVSTLDEAFPLLERLFNAGLLVPEGSDRAKRLEPQFEAGQRVAGVEVTRCIQVTEDSELYQVRDSVDALAALKIVRAPFGPTVSPRVHHEADVLSRLDGVTNPRLLDAGTCEDRAYLLIEWCRGTDAPTAAAQLRWQDDSRSHAQLLNLCMNVIEGYAHLHDQGVVHGDVHPRNLVVGSDGSVKIIDYGLSQLVDEPNDHRGPGRGGVMMFFEPEQAEALKRGHRPPPASVLGEQYALAVLIDLLVTGTSYIEFSSDAETMLGQISTNPPLGFAARGARAWPDLERALGRALNKEPGQRYRSVGEFAQDIRRITLPSNGSETTGSGSTLATEGRSRALLDETLARYQLSGAMLAGAEIKAPTCSVAYGRAGIAHGLYRVACALDDPALLALADAWSTSAMHRVDTPGAFTNAELEIVPSVVGPISTYYGVPGISVVQALISQAMGDVTSQLDAIGRFMEHSTRDCPSVELMMGRSGSLLACAMLNELPPDVNEVDMSPLVAFGRELADGIWDQLDSYAPVGRGADLGYLGMAHGWAGVLYAALRWSQCVGESCSVSVKDRLNQLAERAEPAGQGTRWPVQALSVGPSAYMGGWCNGSAGYIHLWTLAHSMFGADEFLDLAEKAAWDTWAEPSSYPSLCCGLAGRAYGLLNLYQHTGDTTWLRRAHTLADRASHTAGTELVGFEDSLFKGRLGVAVLLADLSRPETASLPFFAPANPS